jgi:hypothetical protein
LTGVGWNLKAALIFILFIAQNAEHFMWLLAICSSSFEKKKLSTPFACLIIGLFVLWVFELFIYSGY